MGTWAGAGMEALDKCPGEWNAGLKLEYWNIPEPLENCKIHVFTSTLYLSIMVTLGSHQVQIWAMLIALEVPVLYCNATGRHPSMTYTMSLRLE